MHSLPAANEVSHSTEPLSTDAAEPAEDLLVEEVSIDGMCGVY